MSLLVSCLETVWHNASVVLQLQLLMQDSVYINCAQGHQAQWKPSEAALQTATTLWTLLVLTEFSWLILLPCRQYSSRCLALR